MLTTSADTTPLLVPPNNLGRVSSSLHISHFAEQTRQYKAVKLKSIHLPTHPVGEFLAEGVGGLFGGVNRR